MLEFMGKIFRILLFIGMASLVGWYDFQVAGYMGVATNLFFAAIGGLLVYTWITSTKPSETKSLIDPDIDASDASVLDETAEAEIITPTTTPQDKDAADQQSKT